MNESVKKAFSTVSNKVEEALKSQGFKKEKIDGTEKEMVSLFTNENVAYSVTYQVEKMYMILRTCAMTEEGVDNEWKTMGTWMFNPDIDTMKEAESIGNDFSDLVSSQTVVKRVQQTKKKKNKDEGTADPRFLAKRFVTYFPELRDLVKEEEESYQEFRGVTFFRTNVVERVNEFLPKAQKNEKNKFAQMLSAQYNNGDMDTRSIITMVILNGVDEKYAEEFNKLLSEELQKAWKFAKKMKGKKVRPEKKKKSMLSYTTERL